MQQKLSGATPGYIAVSATRASKPKICCFISPLLIAMIAQNYNMCHLDTFWHHDALWGCRPVLANRHRQLPEIKK